MHQMLHYKKKTQSWNLPNLRQKHFPMGIGRSYTSPVATNQWWRKRIPHWSKQSSQSLEQLQSHLSNPLLEPMQAGRVEARER
jgi:hypothetical protein